MEAGKQLILVIEDNRDWLRMLKKLCENEEYSVRTAETYDKAAAMLAKFEFDAIVADIRLVDWQKTNIQGLEVLGTVPRDHRPATVVVTAYPDPEHIRTAFRDYQVVDVLWKSDFDKQAFLMVLKTAVQETRKRREAALD